MQIIQLDYSSYVGAIGIGRIQRGTIKTNTPVSVVERDGKVRNARDLQVLGFMGLLANRSCGSPGGRHRRRYRHRRPRHFRHHLRSEDARRSCRLCMVDEPTMSMTFEVNKSPFAARKASLSPAARSASACSAN